MVNSSNEQKNIDLDLNKNLETIKGIIGNSDDLITRKSRIGLIEHDFAIVYIKGLNNEYQINNNILKILELNKKNIESDLFQNVYEEMLGIAEIDKSNELDKVISKLLSGNSVLLLEGINEAIFLGTSEYEFRAIEEPQAESVIRGSRVGFIENIKVNISLVRQELKDPNLRIKTMDVGTHSNQKIAIFYIDGIVKPEILDEVVRRINSIDVDFTPGSGFIEQWIQDSNLSPFPQILDTERPDRLAFNLLKGKIGIIVEGTPSALLMPIVFGDTFESIEDYNQRWIISSLIRLLRFVSFYLTIFLPGLYVALVSFHPELIPTQLLFSIAASREGLPFPSIVEALLLVFFYEVLLEASTRLPEKVSQTIGIVGGIVIGQIAVMAGIVTPQMVIIISLTAICAFAHPNYSFVIDLRPIRFAAIFAAAFLGLYGMILIFIIIYTHLANLKSIGIPYTQSFNSNNLKDLKDILVRPPVNTLSKYPLQPFLKSKKAKESRRNR